MDMSTADWTVAAVAPITRALSVGAGDGAAVRVVSDVMVISPVGAGGTAEIGVRQLSTPERIVLVRIDVHGFTFAAVSSSRRGRCFWARAPPSARV